MIHTCADCKQPNQIKSSKEDRNIPCASCGRLFFVPGDRLWDASSSAVGMGVAATVFLVVIGLVLAFGMVGPEGVSIALNFLKWFLLFVAVSYVGFELKNVVVLLVEIRNLLRRVGVEFVNYSDTRLGKRRE